MATYLLLFLTTACLYAHAVPTPPTTRNTIFIDEKLEGQIFENVEDSDISLHSDPTIYRLPTTTRPIHYTVLWILDMERLTFSGSVSIELFATRANVTEIVLHTDELEIMSVNLQQGTSAINVTYSEQSDLHFLRIQPASALLYNANTPVVYNLTIGFGAELRRDMSGLYRSWFRNSWNDTLRWMATTQFQATHARAAFPCYDEPSFKATFDITIRRPTNYKSWSCTRIRNTTNATTAGYQNDIYYTTPIMSTYLIAVIVAEYDTQDVIVNNTLTYEVIARPGAMVANQSDYAYEVGQELLAAMSEHTGIDFYSVSPHIKMTQASIPDFSAGAMENWGLLTYREAYLMHDPEHTSDHMKQIIAYILSHEIAHMWFGNLVTCDWWDNLWLNEGFARYYQYYLTHWVEDYMGFDTRFVVEQVHTAMLADSANNPHALYHPHVGDPDEVWAMFSTISYNKGACIIRMTEHLLGFEVHRQGLKNYLVNKSFGVALPSDLTQALHNASVTAGAIAQYGDFSVVDYYKTWHDQPGVPVIFVQVNHQTGDMIITQRRFNINYGYAAVNFNWQIPITFATASNPDFNNTKPSHILRKTVTVVNRGSRGDEWVVFNKQQTGYYRVNYDEYTWDLIIIALRGVNRTRIHEYNRAQIVDDTFQFARSGLMSYTRAFNILSFLEQETDYAPWVAAMSGFSWLRNRLAGTDLLPRLENLIARWATPVMNNLTYYPVANETFMRSYLRRQLAPVMCNINVEACRAAAVNQLRSLIVNSTEVPVNSRNWVYCAGLRAGSYDDFAAMWRRYIEHNVYTEKIQLLQTLGCTANETALNELLTSIVQENYEIRPQDYTTTFNTALTGNEGNTQILLEFVKNNLANVTQAFESVSTPLSNIASRLRTVEEVNSFQAWLNQTQVALGDSYTRIYNAAESTRESIAFVQQIRNDINNYLTNGDEIISASTPQPDLVTDPVTVPRPNITVPVTPDIPDSAVTAVLSACVLALAVVTNFVIQ